jgi:hypothetical protein
MSIDPGQGGEAGRGRRLARALGRLAIWTWAIAAGGGGFLLLLEKGPLPLTNGWFAMFSGISICPLTASLVKRLTGIAISTRAQVIVAVLFFIAGRLALMAGI